MKILMIGAGAYGLALSTILSDKNDVIVYSSLEDEIKALKKNDRSDLLNVDLPKLEYVSTLDGIFYDLIVIALPTNIIRKVITNINIGYVPVVIASKGISENKFAYEIVKDVLPNNELYILSGPSFAKDTILRERISLTLAGKNSEYVKNIFNQNYVSIDTTNDMIGTAICGSLKNVFAISCGMLDGMGVSESTKAAFLTKVINETRSIIGLFMGDVNTVLLSCGIGDIFLTCTSSSSRNFTLGYMIGKGLPIEEYLNNNTVEGLGTLISFKDLLKQNNMKVEIIDLIYDIIYESFSPKKLLEFLSK